MVLLQEPKAREDRGLDEFIAYYASLPFSQISERKAADAPPDGAEWNVIKVWPQNGLVRGIEAVLRDGTVVGVKEFGLKIPAPAYVPFVYTRLILPWESGDRIVSYSLVSLHPHHTKKIETACVEIALFEGGSLFESGPFNEARPVIGRKFTDGLVRYFETKPANPPSGERKPFAASDFTFFMQSAEPSSGEKAGLTVKLHPLRITAAPTPNAQLPYLYNGMWYGVKEEGGLLVAERQSPAESLEIKFAPAISPERISRLEALTFSDARWVTELRQQLSVSTYQALGVRLSSVLLMPNSV